MKLKELKSCLTVLKDFDEPKIELEQYTTPTDLAATIIHVINSTYNDILNKKVLDLCAGTGIIGISSYFYSPNRLYFVECDTASVDILKENLEIFDIRYLNITINNITETKNELCDKSLNSTSNKIIIEDCKKQCIINIKDYIKQAEISTFLKTQLPDQIEDGYDNKKANVFILNNFYEELENQNVFKNKYFDTIIMNPPFGTRNKHADINVLQYATKIGKVVYSIHKRSTRDYLKSKFKNLVVLAELSWELKRTYKYHKKNKKYIEVDLIRISSS